MNDREASNIFLFFGDRYPLATAFIYLALGVLGACGFWSSWNDLKSFTSPKNVTIAEAIQSPEDSQWVNVTGLRSQCNHPIETNDEQRPDIPMTDVTESVLVIYSPRYHGQFRCEDLAEPVRGMLRRIPTNYYIDLVHKNLPLVKRYARFQIWSLCGYCDPSNSKLGLILTGAFSLLFFSGFIYHFGDALKKRLGIGRHK